MAEILVPPGGHTALSDPASVFLELVDESRHRKGMTEAEAYAFLAGADSSSSTLPPIAVAAAEVHTGAMVALVPSLADRRRLAVDGGEPIDQLHTTLVYLGEAAEISGDVREAIVARLRSLVVDAPLARFAAEGFSINVFNPPGHVKDDGKERDTCIVLGVGGAEIDRLHTLVTNAVSRIDGLKLPEQHKPWVPHITLTYTDDVTQIRELTDKVGPVNYTKLRIAFAGDVVDVPLGELLTANYDPNQPRDEDGRWSSIEELTDSEMTDAWSESVKSLTERQLLGVAVYKGDLGFKEMNTLLRGSKRTGSASENALLGSIEDLKSAMRPNPRGVRAFRGTSTRGLGLGDNPSVDDVKALVGKDIVEPGFSSLSTKRQKASQFFQGVIMEVDVPKGAPSLWLDGIQSVQADYNESEMLLPPNAKLRITSVEAMPYEGRTAYRVKATVVVS